MHPFGGYSAVSDAREDSARSADPAGCRSFHLFRLRRQTACQRAVRLPDGKGQGTLINMARNKPAAHVRNPFYHPVPEEYDYARLLDALRESREMARKLTLGCGLRNPIYRETEALIAQIDAVAALTRVSGAPEFVNPDDYTVTAARQ